MAANTYQTSDGLSIHTVQWLPTGAPRAVVVIVHGIAEHSGRYAHVAQHLTAHGYAVYGLDHRGHGHSTGERVHFDSFDQPVGDLAQFVSQVKAAHEGLPVFIFGHSMGSLISLLYLLQGQGQEGIAGFISSGTPLLLTAPAPVVAVSAVLQRFAPRLKLIALNEKDICSDPAVLAAHQADTLVYHERLRVGTVYALLQNARHLRDKINQLRLPLLILHGEADQLTPPAGSQYMLQHAAAEDKTLKMYPGMLHEIVNEPGKAAVLEDIAVWLNARTTASP